MTSSTGWRPSEKVVWAWRFPFRRGMTCREEVGRRSGCEAPRPPCSLPRHTDADGEPPADLAPLRPLRQSRRGRPPRYADRPDPTFPGPGGQGLDEAGLVLDWDVLTVEFGCPWLADLRCTGGWRHHLEWPLPRRSRRTHLHAALGQAGYHGPEDDERCQCRP